MRREFVSLTRTAVVGLAFGGALLSSACSNGEASGKPNIVLILADDLGYGDLSSYGATKVRTPNIDSLATQGVLFTDAHTEASRCTLTRYGLSTGRYSWRTWLKYSALSTSAPPADRARPNDGCFAAEVRRLLDVDHGRVAPRFRT